MKIFKSRELKENLFRLDLAILSFFALLAFSAVSYNLNLAVNKDNSSNMQAAVADYSNNVSSKPETSTENTNARIFDEPLVEAKAYAVFDLKEHKLIAGKNEEVPLPLASLTKIFTAILGKHYLDNDTVVIRREDLDTEGYSGLKEGSAWDAKTLAAYMLVVSSNDAAEALRRKLEEKTSKPYSQLVKELSSDLNLKQSFALNPSGLDESADLAGAYSSAKELAKLINYASNYAPEIFTPTEKKELKFYDLDGNEYLAKNTNSGVEYIFNILASKTGYTDLAGGNLAVLFEIEPGHPIAIVVLGSSKSGRFQDVKKLYEASLKYLK